MERRAVKEVLGLLKKAEKAVAGKTITAEKESRCVDALSQLKYIPLTVETLVSSNAGKLLRPWRNHPHKKIRDLASSVYESWAKLVAEAKKNQSLGEAKKTQTSALKSQEAKRELIRGKLHQGLCMVLEETEEGDITRELVEASDPAGVALRVEEALFNNWGPGRLDNHWKYRSLCFNINDPGNPDFRRKVLVGQVEPERIVGLMGRTRLELARTRAEMASNELQAEYERFEEISDRRRLIANTQEATTDQFKCGKCGKRETTYYQLQTRSADEPMTQYITCVSCQNRWKS
ncbi:hypothetical protein Tsubulata_037824 [Turnera subulata]|uniref:Uncharacterized protein n=1 Tax=Turnera subulata TaxID=218843 RepID=A0A9Q0EZL0_9ROSI|nr:hypothetical protein Tsubulata_037824 [Turnera subulata]